MRAEDRRSAETRSRLITKAEQLFAERGIEGVSLRDISAEAGQRNTSAAQYHFGSREGLLLAIVDFRMAPINADRLQRLAEAEAQDKLADLQTLVDALVSPLVMAIPLHGGSYYATFLSRFVVDEHFRDSLVRRDCMSGLRRLLRLITRHLDDAELAAGRRRLMFANTMLTHVMAEYERASRDRDFNERRRRALAADLTDAIVGLLSAPVSESAHAREGAA